jgi:large subunit ribosomal protein L9
MAKQYLENKLLLIEDVYGLGRSGDVVAARPGYARNFLLPRKLAVIADAHTLKMQKRLQEARRQRAIADQKEAEEIAEKFKDVNLQTVVKIDQEGHMYGSVSVLDIVHLCQEQLSITLEKRHVLLPHPIKTVGTHTIHLKLKEGTPASFTLQVVPENVETM